MKFLQELLKYSQWNQLDVDFLTILFSRILLGYEMNKEKAQTSNTVMAIIRFLLTPPAEKEDAHESDSDY